MAKYTTPGVYIEEQSWLPGAISAVPTGIPVFIGYTEKAEDGGNTLSNTAVKVNSIREYEQFFGGGHKCRFRVTVNSDGSVDVRPGKRSMLYDSLRLFYANGGGACYILSVGGYESDIDPTALIAGLASRALASEDEPSIVLIPDAAAWGISEAAKANSAPYYTICNGILAHCEQNRYRFGILDVLPGDTPETAVANFRAGMGQQALSYGAAYYPWLKTNLYSEAEPYFLHIETGKAPSGYADNTVIETLEKILPEERALQLLEAQKQKNGTRKKKPARELLITANGEFENRLRLHSPTYRSIISPIQEQLSILPPSGALAGIYASVDSSRGVWKAPANVSLNSVTSLTANITNQQQEDMNISADGKSVNAVRNFPGKGILVWGARTLAGNDNEWRYISVRRTLMMLEESVKAGTRPFVFEPNDANTWVKAKGMIDNFLNTMWRQGTLAGAKPGDAFFVHIGLGQTMTAQDILENRMIIEFGVAIVRPAEFVVVRIEQKMMGA